METGQSRSLLRADLITGVVLLALGLGVLAESIGMPRLEERNINPWTVPGLVPGMLGIIVAILGALLTLRSVSAGAFALPSDLVSQEEAAEARASRVRLGWCLGLCIAYAAGLLGRMPFWIATGLFVFAFIAVFEWRGADSARIRSIRLAVAATIAVVTMIAIPLLFERLFLVRLP